MEREVHGRASGHEPLKEAGGERAWPLAEVEGADEPVADADVAAVDDDLDGFLAVAVCGRAAEGGCEQELAEGASDQRVDGEACAFEETAQVGCAVVLADGVEAAVEDAAAVLERGEEIVQRVCGGGGLRRQVRGLGVAEPLAQRGEIGRMLSDEELDGEVEGVERSGESAEFGFVEFEPQHLADGEFDAVDADGAVVLDVREHEAAARLTGEKHKLCSRPRDEPIAGTVFESGWATCET